MNIYYDINSPLYYLSIYFGGRFPLNGNQWNFNITPRPCYTIILNPIETTYLILDRKFPQNKLGDLLSVYKYII